MLHTDRWGRLMPAIERFPSAAGGVGFKPLADYVHGKGLKFGIHVMRGIPRQAVHEDLQICGGKYRAREAANPESTCNWLNHMVGVRASEPAGQAYYDSLFELYASWGVDFVKVDDILADGNFDSDGPYHESEIEAVSRAIEKCGRPMVLSLSPGDAPKSAAAHVGQFASMWRMSADFWDDWRRLKRQFDLCHWWTPHRQPGRWPDADMLPIGRLSKRGPKGPERESWFSRDEHYTLMTLWSIYRSPLMMGGCLTDLDEFTRELLTNDEVLAANQQGAGGVQLLREGDFVVWTAAAAGGREHYVALFNLGDAPRAVSFAPGAHGLPTGSVRDLWRRAGEPLTGEKIVRDIPAHGCAFFRLAP
jgi:hypothetical protein